MTIDLGGKGFMGILAVVFVVCLVLYAGSYLSTPGGFTPFLDFGIAAFAILIIVGIFGGGGGSSLIAKFR